MLGVSKIAGKSGFPVFERASSRLSDLRGECNPHTRRQSTKSAAVRTQEEVREEGTGGEPQDLGLEQGWVPGVGAWAQERTRYTKGGGRRPQPTLQETVAHQLNGPGSY